MAETACGLPISVVIMRVSTCVRAATSPEPEPRGSQVLRLAASRGGPRNALGHRPEPEVLPLPAETSREAPKCCAWQHQGGGGLPLPAETSREAPKCCAWQGGAKPSAAPGSIKGGGGPETRSGTVQSLKCCPCQQKPAARLPSAAPGSIKRGAPKRARVPSRA